MAKTMRIDGKLYRLVRVADDIGRPRNNHSPLFMQTLLFQRQTMKVREIAEYYGKSEATINRWLKEAKDWNAKEES